MFTQSAFIRKNTPDLLKKLEELGYKIDTKICRMPDSDTLYITATGVYATYSDMEVIDESDGFIDCETNEDLFLALAALRDDLSMNQWHIADSDIRYLWSDQIGNDHCGTIKKGEYFFWELWVEYSNVFKGEYHKATPAELIEHFKIEPEYECTNTNSYGINEYREGCKQSCDECDYCQQKVNN